LTNSLGESWSTSTNEPYLRFGHVFNLSQNLLKQSGHTKVGLMSLNFTSSSQVRQSI
jgi:hypothetical protein